MTDLSAPIFDFGGHPQLTANDAYTRLLPTGLFALTSPSVKAAAGHLPVRGDLAHIKLAGLYFVPHYAVPMPHEVINGGAILREAGRPDASEVQVLPTGAGFDVLDIAGAWAWGQYGEDGPVGYVLLADLAVIAP